MKKSMKNENFKISIFCPENFPKKIDFKFWKYIFVMKNKYFSSRFFFPGKVWLWRFRFWRLWEYPISLARTPKDTLWKTGKCCSYYDLYNGGFIFAKISDPETEHFTRWELRVPATWFGEAVLFHATPPNGRPNRELIRCRIGWVMLFFEGKLAHGWRKISDQKSEIIEKTRDLQFWWSASSVGAGEWGVGAWTTVRVVWDAVTTP